MTRPSTPSPDLGARRARGIGLVLSASVVATAVVSAAAVVSGAGPSVLTLTTRAGRDAVPDLLTGDPAWRVLVPGIPDRGAVVDR